jgi:hypothetical protein
VHIEYVYIISCAFKEIQLQMHKLAPFLRVQLDQDSNAQFMGRLNQLMYQQIEKNYANSIFIFNSTLSDSFTRHLRPSGM